MTIWTNLRDYTFPAQVFYPSSWPTVYDLVGASGAIPSESTDGQESGWLDDVVASPEAGAIIPGFTGDFYGRIHVTPHEIALGNIIGVQNIPVRLWNTFYVDRRIEATVLSDTDGMSLTGQAAPPFWVSPLEEISWVLQIDTSGSPIVDALLTFDLDNDEFHYVAITGRRVTAWAWPADWSQGILERLEWKTDVIPAYDGREQRRKLRIQPRRSLEFRFLVEARDRQIMETIAWGWGGRVFAVPFWPDGTNLDVDLPAGSMSVGVDTDTRDYQVGGLVVFLGDTARDWEVCEIDAVTSSSVDFRRATIATWAAGTRIYPAFPARLPGGISMQHFTGDASYGRVIFDSVDTHYWSAYGGSESYRGYPVLPVRPNWSDDPEENLERKWARFDPGIGVQYFDDESQRPVQRQPHHFVLSERSEIDSWRRFLHAMAGRHGSVWLRSRTRDMQIAAPLLSASSALDVEWIGYKLFVWPQPGKIDVCIELTNGVRLYRRVVDAVELDASTERLTLDSGPGVDIQVDDVAAISFMSLVRLDSDAIELAWWTGDAAESRVTFTGFHHDV